MRQEEAAILRPAVDIHHVVTIRLTKEIFQIFLVGVGENIPLVIGVKLLPEGSNVVFRDGFTDGDLFFHFVSSKTLFGGLGSVNPPYTTQFHKKPPFLLRICRQIVCCRYYSRRFPELQEIEKPDSTQP